MAADRKTTQRDVVLYRCKAPTNRLCPCGRVARTLDERGIPHRSQRVPGKRKGRPDIVALTGQDAVPVLVDGDRAIHDSKQIVRYLEERDAG